MGQDGWQCVEYDLRVPRCLIEYKAAGKRFNASDANNSTLSLLGTMANLPFFIVHYSPDMSYFVVHPINDIAQKILPETEFDEAGYKAWLLEIRQKPSANCISQA